MNKVLVSIAGLAFAGCAATMNRGAPTEKMNAAGPIRPCVSNSGDTRGCGNAFFNTAVWITFTDHSVSSLSHEVLERD